MLIKAGELTMEEKSPKPPKQESVQQKKGTMQKCRFNKKFSCMNAMVIALGLTVGLLYCLLCVWVIRNPGKSDVGEAKEDNKGTSQMGKSLLTALIMVEIFITCRFIVAWVVFAKTPKPDTNRILTLIRICLTSGVLLPTVVFVCRILAYPNTEICFFVIFLVLVTIMLVAFMYLVNKNDDDENRLIDVEANELQQFSAYKIETV